MEIDINKPIDNEEIELADIIRTPNGCAAFLLIVFIILLIAIGGTLFLTRFAR